MRLDRPARLPWRSLWIVVWIVGLGVLESLGLPVQPQAFGQRPAPRGPATNRSPQPPARHAEEPASGPIRVGDQVYLWHLGQLHTAQVEKINGDRYDLRLQMDNVQIAMGQRPRSSFSLRPLPADASQPLPAPTLSNGVAARTWTDTSGRFEQVASFLRVDGTDVVLKKPDGSLLRVPVDKLSKADRDYLRDTAGPTQASPPERDSARSGDRSSRSSDRGADDVKKLVANPRRSTDLFQIPDTQPQRDNSQLRSIVFSPQVSWRVPLDQAAATTPPTVRSFSWPVPSGESDLEMPTMSANADGSLLAIAWSEKRNDRSQLQVCFVDDLDDCPTVELSDPVCRVSDVSPGGHWLLTSNDHGFADLWFVTRDKLSYQKRVNNSYRVRFLDDERLLYLEDQSIMVSDLRSLRGLYQFPVSGPRAYALSANRRLLACHAQSSIWVLDANSGDVLGRIESQLEPNFGAGESTGVRLAICPRGDVLIAQANNQFELYDLSRGTVAARFEVPDMEPVTSLHWINDDLVLCSGEYLLDPARKMVVWRLTTNTPEHRAVPRGDTIWYVARYRRNAWAFHAMQLPPPDLARTPAGDLPGSTFLGRYGPE